jgi:hypothetical protein
MNAKISLTAAFLLMAMPPIACASIGDAANPVRMSCQAQVSRAGTVLAQDNDSNSDASDSDNDKDDKDNDDDNDSNDSADNSQNNADTQTDQENGAGDTQPVPPTVLNGGDSGASQGDQVPPSILSNPNR